MALFESYERRIDKINGVLAQYGIGSVEECREICKAKGFDPYEIVKGIQPICFENACWAYTVGAAIAIKSGVKSAAEAAKMIGVGLQSFCIDGSVAEDRKVGLGHGNLGAMLLSDESKCFAFLAGHESFAAAEGAIGIVRNANKARKEPLRVILNGLGKDAAQIISRINGFTYVQTQFDYFTGKLNIVREIRYSETERADVRCYGADDVREGVAIMHSEGVDVSITGNSTNPTRFQHPVAGTYKKECIEQGKKYFSVASGGGTGRTLHPDNMAAGPASYGMTDTMGEPEVRKTYRKLTKKQQFHKTQSTRFHEETGAFAFLSTFCQPLLKVGTKMMQWAMSLFECVFYMRTQIAACCEDIPDVDGLCSFICGVNHNILPCDEQADAFAVPWLFVVKRILLRHKRKIVPDRILQASVPAFGGGTVVKNAGDVLKLFSDIVGGSICVYDIVFVHVCL